MLAENTIVRDRQLAMRREMDRRQISLKCVAADSGIPYPTIISYFPGERDKEPHTMPVSAYFALTRALPLDLLSMMLPDDILVLRVVEGVNHDDMAAQCLAFATEVARARHPDSEAGVDIGPGEEVVLNEKVAQIRA